MGAAFLHNWCALEHCKQGGFRTGHCHTVSVCINFEKVKILSKVLSTVYTTNLSYKECKFRCTADDSQKL